MFVVIDQNLWEFIACIMLCTCFQQVPNSPFSLSRNKQGTKKNQKPAVEEAKKIECYTYYLLLLFNTLIVVGSC